MSTIEQDLYLELKYAIDCVEHGCIPGPKWLDRAKQIAEQAQEKQNEQR